MARSLIQLYALTVCFATLMCLVVALGLGIYDLIRIAAPGFTVPDYMRWQSDEDFLRYHPDKSELPEEDRAALREKYRQTALEVERRSALQRLVFVAIIVGINDVVYASHWLIAKSAETRPPSVAPQHPA
jgi:hypothetical protein